MSEEKGQPEKETEQTAKVPVEPKPENTVMKLGLVAKEAVVIGISSNGEFFYQLHGTTHYNALRHLAAAQVAFFHLAHPGFHVPPKSTSPAPVKKQEETVTNGENG